MKKYLRFAPWITGFFAVGLLVSCVAYEEHRAADEYKHHRAEWCSANFTTAQQKEACKEEKTDAQDYVPWEVAIISWPVGITAWAVLGTLVVIGWQSNETRRAANATEASVESGKETAKRQLRAYVVPELATIGNIANPAEVYENDTPTAARITHPNWGPLATIQIKNTGQTPSFHVVHRCGICVRPHPLREDLPALTLERASCMILGPGVIGIMRVNLPQALEEYEIESLRRGTAAIYVQGDILYTDVFGDKWFTKYRLMHTNAAGRIGVSTDLTFCPEGNEGT
jgi:hypothetical protein